ncbi:MAG: DUF5013 domain-containing protein [Prevotellaceae bacterium]|nr:DUF5013 domain-containing protein [Prevotellaceae bacterium]
MKRFKIPFFTALATLVMASLTQFASAQEVDKTKFPDYIPFDAARQKLMPQSANRGSARSNALGQRPDHINNALSMYYPPIFNQSGGSCGSAQAIGYMFTHEMNSWRNTDASFEENQYPTHFTWLFTTPGVEKINIMVGNGIPNVTTYGGRTYSNDFGYQTTDNYYFGWMQGYDKWYKAMFNRTKEFFFGPRVSRTNEDTQEQLKQWLWNRWGAEGYHDGGVAGFGVASGGTWGRIPSTPTNDELGVSNMYCVAKWGKTYDHGMTICGYDDRIEFDLDTNGIVGEKDKGEVGAWIICNSWGAGWCNKGFIYCPYAFSYCVFTEQNVKYLDWATELYNHRPDFVPQRTIKITMDYDHRWELQLSAGISQDTASATPQATTNFSHFSGTDKYDVDGVSPEVPMLGRWADGYHYEPMEFGYDLTDLGERFDKSKPLKYFFFIKTKTGGVGSGHLYKASILNYEYEKNDPVEIPFDIDTLEIKGGEATLCVSVVVPGEALNPPLNATLSENTLSWTSPTATSLPLVKYYIYNGNTLTDSVTASKKTYTVADKNAVYSVAAAYNYKGRLLTSEKSNTASNPVIIEKGDNNILTLNQNSITIPDAVAKSYPQGTIEFMVKVNALNGSLNKMGSDNGNFIVNISASGQVVAGWSTKNASDYVSTAAGTIKTGKWYHVAVTIDNSDIAIYIDGMKKKSGSSTNYSGMPALGNFTIGLDGTPMNASIDEFRVWKTARTMSEIYSGKDETISNPAALNDLLIYLPMNLIESEGETKVREYALANHAFFANQDYKQSVDNTILTGSKLSTALSIVGESDSVTAGTPVKYSATCPISTTSWQWSTPGAENSSYTSQSPYIVYNKAGKYTMELTITKADNTTASTSKEIVVLPAELPTASFVITDPNKSAGEAFSFINRSTGANTTYKWTLTGSQNETLFTTNATAIYDLPGTYTATLTATNTTGSTSMSKEIVVKAAAPTPQFSVSPSSILLGETTYLVDESRGVVDNWLWTIDNQTHLSAINGQNSSFTPTHPGVYDISLTSGNEVGSKTLTKKKLLYVSNADPKNSLSFSGNETVEFTCPLTTNSKTWTIEWWMNPSQYSGAGGFYTQNGFAKMCGNTDGSYKITINNSSLTSSPGYIIVNEWHHYAITYSLGTMKFYRDGILWETPESKLTYTTGNWSGTMTISNADTPYKGLIDELRIWSKAVTATNIKTFANTPINEPESQTGLTLYYNFNQGQGDVIDQTVFGHDGSRIGFGPDGDAWPLALGVFTLDLDNDGNTEQTVTSQYLTNYERPFLYNDAKNVNTNYTGRFFGLEQGTQNSTWQLRDTKTIGNVTTGVHVDKNYSYDFCMSTRYQYFADTLHNHRAYQVINLPAGKYKFSISAGSYTGNYKNSYLVATAGNELATNDDVKSSLAYTALSDGASIEFILGRETEVSLGVLYNFDSYARFNIQSFSLVHQPMELIQADGETNVYESIANGHAQEARGREGGIVIATETKKNFRIYNAAGQCVFNDMVHGTHFLPFDKGIYIVNGQKISVK